MDCVFVLLTSIAVVLDGVKAIKNGSVKKDFGFLNFLIIPAFTFGIISRFLFGAIIVVKYFILQVF